PAGRFRWRRGASAGGGALPLPGPPFHIGDRIAMLPAIIGLRVNGPESVYLDWDEAVIDTINEEAESFSAHIVSGAGQFSQGFENIVRANETYHAWRAAWLVAFARSGDSDIADRETRPLWLQVLAEHPEHGSSGPYRHQALGPV
ncbi:MAG TPA: hypothetical protein VF375_07710, partial [Candidatus Limnocylindrales bacterium]